MQKSIMYAVALSTALFSSAVYAKAYVITLKGDHFSPQELIIPAHEKIKLTVKNLNTAAAEFESEELNREKVVGAKSEIVVFIGPLEAGSYGYVDDFHSDTRKGTITAK